MATFYTLDRSGNLSPGMTVNLAVPDYTVLINAGLSFDSAFLSHQFPAGLSLHGQRYLLNWSTAVQGVREVNGERFA